MPRMTGWWAPWAALTLVTCGAPEERGVGFEHNFTSRGGQGGMAALGGRTMAGGMPAEMPDAAGGMAQIEADAGIDEAEGGAAGLDGGAGGMGMGGQAGTGGNMIAGGIDDARFNFEASTQQWGDITGSRHANHVVQAPVLSKERSFAGNGSLEFSIVAGADAVVPQVRAVGVVSGAIGTLPPGATVTYRLWVPTGHRINWVEAFIQTFTSGSWKSTSKSGFQLETNAWNTFTVVVPETYVNQGPLELGLLFNTAAAWSGKVWVDSIDVK